MEISLSHPRVTRAQQPTSGEGFFAYHGLWAPGVRLFRQLRFAWKALIISAAFMLPVLVLLAWLMHGQYREALDARMEGTRRHVEVAHGVLAWAYAEEAAGRMTRAQAQAAAVSMVRSLRYDQNEYFWINDMQPRMVMHPFKPELDGQAIGAMKDPNGFALFEAMAAIVRRDGKGFVAYQWPRPGRDEPADKVSYVLGHAPWGWIIGSGVYTDDLKDAAVTRAVRTAGVVLATLLVAGYLFLCFYRVMDGGLKETRRHLRAMSLRPDLIAFSLGQGRGRAAHAGPARHAAVAARRGGPDAGGERRDRRVQRRSGPGRDGPVGAFGAGRRQPGAVGRVDGGNLGHGEERVGPDL